MSSTYKFLSKWTRIDELLAPYSDRIFAKVAEGHGPRMMGVAYGASFVMLAITLLGAAFLVTLASKQVALDVFGVTTTATIKTQSFDTTTDRRGDSTHWTTISYAFSAADGSVRDAQVRIKRPAREPREPTGLSSGTLVSVIYWDRFPTVQSLVQVRENYFGLALGLIGFLLFGVHTICFRSRYISWRRSQTAHKAGELAFS